MLDRVFSLSLVKASEHSENKDRYFELKRGSDSCVPIQKSRPLKHELSCDSDAMCIGAQRAAIAAGLSQRLLKEATSVSITKLS